MTRELIILISLLTALVPFVTTARAQTSAVATAVRFQENAESDNRTLFAMIAGQERKISDAAFEAWIVNNGMEIAYAGTEDDDDENASLRIYAVATNETRKVIFIGPAYFFTAVKDVKFGKGKRLLFVTGGDEVSGASHLWIVDPRRGAVFYRDSCLVTRIRRDNVTLAFFRDRDWEIINQEDFPDNRNSVISRTRVKPSRTQIYDLNKIANSNVIDTRKDVINER